MTVSPIHASNGRLITSTYWDNLPTPLAPSTIITHLAPLHSLRYSKMKNLRRFQHWRGTWPYQEPLAIPKTSLGDRSLGMTWGSSASELTSHHSKRWTPWCVLEVNPRWRFGENESFLSRTFWTEPVYPENMAVTTSKCWGRVLPVVLFALLVSKSLTPILFEFWLRLFIVTLEALCWESISGTFL